MRFSLKIVAFRAFFLKTTLCSFSCVFLLRVKRYSCEAFSCECFARKATGEKILVRSIRAFFLWVISCAFFLKSYADAFSFKKTHDTCFFFKKKRMIPVFILLFVIFYMRTRCIFCQKNGKHLFFIDSASSLFC